MFLYLARSAKDFLCLVILLIDYNEFSLIGYKILSLFFFTLFDQIKCQPTKNLVYI